MGENVADNKPTIDTGSSDNSNSSAGAGSNNTVVTDAMLRQWEQEMIERVNEERAKVGAPALEIDDNLMAFAQYWAEHLTTDFRHSAWSDLQEYAQNKGINADDIDGGENITGAGNINGIGYDPVTIAINKIMNSEGHKNTMLEPGYTRIGIGFAVNPSGTVYCDQSFGR